MSRLIFIAAGITALFLLGACYNVQASFISCETNQDCVEETGGDFDFCGQEGQNLCCVAGSFKCGCQENLGCLEDYGCYACNDTVCANNQPTICLDEFGASIGGLSLAEPPILGATD